MDPFIAYYNRIARELDRRDYDWIRNTPQPTLMGGQPLRQHPLPGFTTQEGEPDTLAVGAPRRRDRLGQIPDGRFFEGVQGGRRRFGWNDISNGFKTIVNDVVAPVGKEIAKDMLKTKLKGGRQKKMRPKEVGGYSIGDFARDAAPIALPMLMGLGRPRKRKAKAETPYPESVRGGNIAGGCSKGRSARNAIVQKVMKEKGLKLIEASKYVKAHGLY